MKFLYRWRNARHVLVLYDAAEIYRVLGFSPACRAMWADIDAGTFNFRDFF